MNKNGISLIVYIIFGLIIGYFILVDSGSNIPRGFCTQDFDYSDNYWQSNNSDCK